MNFEITDHIQLSIKNLKDNLNNDYNFSPVATEKEVENFEKRFSIIIPEDFRWFLLNIANGVESSDPMQYDLFQKIDFSDYYFEEDMHNPSLPFKLTRPFNYHHDEFEDFNNGTIHLAGYGCGCYSFLVINGEEYGNIWTDNYASNSEVYPEKTAHRKRMKFYEWLSQEVEQAVHRKRNYEKENHGKIQKEKKLVMNYSPHKSAYLASKTDNKSKLFYSLFSPETVKATLLIVHGMQEHSGRYSEIAEYFAAHGIAVLTYDHLGHGKSVKEKKDIGFFQLDQPDERLVSDAEMMADHLAEQYPDVPHFILGHSMGSFITRCLLQKASAKFSGAIITGTGGPLPGIDILRGYLSLANAIASHYRTFLNSVFTNVNNKHFKKDKDFGPTSWLSINPKNRTAFEQDELCGIPFTHNAFYTLFTVYKRATARDWASSISKSFPLLFVSGQNDPIGDFSKGVIYTVDHLKADGFQDIEVKIYPDMRHEILNEEIREEVLNGIYKWILKHCK